MLRNVHLLGELGDKFGNKFRLDVQSVGEALRALNSNFPGFMNLIKKNEYYNVCVGSEISQNTSLSEQEVLMNHKEGDIWIMPQIVGAKSAGVLQIVVGAVLVIAGAVLTYYGFGNVGIPMMKMGAGMIIAGFITSLTAPGAYEEREDPDERSGFLFDGPINTNEQGGSIPIVYGRMLVGSTVISTSMDVEDVYIPPPEPESVPEVDVVPPEASKPAEQKDDHR